MSNEVTCRNCGARNRVKAPARAGGLRPVCGRCGAPLGEETPISTTPPMDRRAENRRAIALIVIVALVLTGFSELLLIILR